MDDGRRLDFLNSRQSGPVADEVVPIGAGAVFRHNVPVEHEALLVMEEL